MIDTEESTKTLKSTINLYDTYTSLLQTSTKLVKHLEKADWYDRLIIFMALLFFLLVVGFIVKKRVLDKMARGVGWWVGGSFKLVKMGFGLGGKRAVQSDGVFDGRKVLKDAGKVIGTVTGVAVSLSSILSASESSLKQSGAIEVETALPISTASSIDSAISTPRFSNQNPTPTDRTPQASSTEVANGDPDEVLTEEEIWDEAIPLPQPGEIPGDVETELPLETVDSGRKRDEL